MARADYPSQRSDKFMLRLPDGMRARIAGLARSNLRSMNSEIVMMLANALGDQGQTTAGVQFGDQSPAVAPNAPLAGGAPTHGL